MRHCCEKEYTPFLSESLLSQKRAPRSIDVNENGVLKFTLKEFEALDPAELLLRAYHWDLRSFEAVVAIIT
jgi:hypothetical protein